VPFSLKGFRPPRPRRGRGSNLHQNLHWTGGDVLAKFHQIGAGVWISISPPHTNRQTDKQTSVHAFLYREMKTL